MLTASPNQTWLRAMPAVFVLIWSTGFIVARYGMPYAPPFSFLAVRYALSIACFLPWIVWAKVPWPQSRAQWLHLGLTGVFMHINNGKATFVGTDGKRLAKTHLKVGTDATFNGSYIIPLKAVEEIMPISSRLIINQAALKLKRDTIQPILDAFSAAIDSQP